jgi:hypothetical protein
MVGHSRNAWEGWITPRSYSVRWSVWPDHLDLISSCSNDSSAIEIFYSPHYI